MAEDDLPPPLEIPWKLAATTQPLAAGEPDETTISLFFFEPGEEDVDPLPEDRLIYLRFTASAGPAAPERFTLEWRRGLTATSSDA